MKTHNIRRFRPMVSSVERRMLLASFAYVNPTINSNPKYNRLDLVGPNAGVGPDGKQDAEFTVSGLPTNISDVSITVSRTNNSLVTWADGKGQNPNGTSVFQSTIETQAQQSIVHVYINSVSSDAGGTNSHQLTQGNQIHFNITYKLNSVLQPTISGDVTVGEINTNPVTPGLPNTINASWSITSLQESATSPYPGFAHLTLTSNDGFTFSGADTYTISNSVGSLWSSSNDDGTGRRMNNLNDKVIVITGSNPNQIDLLFRPNRDETPLSSDQPLNMMLRVYRNGIGHYLERFSGQSWDLSLLATTSPPLSTPTEASSEQGLQDALDRGESLIYLAPGSTVQIVRPLKITHSVTITTKIPQGGQLTPAKLTFVQSAGAPFDANAPGMIYTVNPHNVTNLGNSTVMNVALTNMIIDFDQFNVIQWQKTPNNNNAPYWNPNSSLDMAYTHAFISTGGGSSLNKQQDSQARVNLKLDNLVFTTAPAVNAPDPTSQYPISQPVDNPSFFKYVGEQALPLVASGVMDSGTITNCVFKGGKLELSGGPWKISDNQFHGATTRSFNYAAIGFSTYAHDINISRNQVSQDSANAYTFRLVNFGSDGSPNANITVQQNSFADLPTSQGHVGYEEVFRLFKADTNTYGDIIGSPEIILTEPKYRFQFEGAPGSYNDFNRVLGLVSYRGLAPQPGDIVSIVSGSMYSSSAGSPARGKWARIAQIMDTQHYLLDSSLPTFDPLNPYVITITPGFTNVSLLQNNLATPLMANTGIVLNSAFDSVISGNVITGGTRFASPFNMSRGITVYAAGTTSQTAFSLFGVNDPAAQTSFPVQDGYSHSPTFNVSINNNTLINEPDGIDVYSQSYFGTNSTSGRTYTIASVVSNTFQWTQAFINQWADVLNAANNSQAGGNPNRTAALMPTTITVGDGGLWVIGSQRRPFGIASSNPITYVTGYVEPNIVNTRISSNRTFIDGLAYTAQSGQVYAGIINGVSLSPPLGTQSFPYNYANYSMTPLLGRANDTVPGDYYGTGQTDIANFRPTASDFTSGAFITINGATNLGQITTASQLSSSSFTITPGRDIPIGADYNQDGKIDYGVFRRDTAQWYYSGGPVFQFGLALSDEPIPGDYDGDGTVDLAAFRPSIAQWAIGASTPRVIQFGQGGLDRPVTGDFNGDGRTDFAAFRPGTDQFFVYIINPNVPNGSQDNSYEVNFSGLVAAQSGDIPAPGDYEGVGRTEVAFYRPSDQKYYVINPFTNGLHIFKIFPSNEGNSNDVPVAADYDGDRKTDPAVFRPSTSTWYIFRSATSTLQSFQFGQGGNDVAIPGRYSYRMTALRSPYAPSGAYNPTASGGAFYGASLVRETSSTLNGSLPVVPGVVNPTFKVSAPVKGIRSILNRPQIVNAKSSRIKMKITSPHYDSAKVEMLFRSHIFKDKALSSALNSLGRIYFGRFHSLLS